MHDNETTQLRNAAAVRPCPAGVRSQSKALDPSRVSAETRLRGNIELVRRTRPGTFAYAVLALIVAAGTPVREDYPLLAIGLLAVQLGLAITRAIWGARYGRLYRENARRARLVFSGLVITAALTWGLFAGFTLARYDTTWTTLLVMLCTAGLLAGGTTALCLRRGLHTAWVVAMTGPLIVVCFTWQGGQAWLFGAVILLYISFLLREAQYLHRSFWRSLEKSLLLDAENERKRRFLASISHEIRTPMTCILGMLQLVRDDQGHPANQERLDTIDGSARELLRLVNELLDVPQLEKPEVEIAVGPYDPCECVADVVRLVMPHAAQKSIILSLESDDSVPAEIVGDRGRVRQVLLNLVHNSVKFTDTGAVNVTVARSQHEGQTSWIEFIVEDTGPGMSESDVAWGLGSGEELSDNEGRLGLRNAHFLVRKMGGTLSIHTEPRVGTRVKVSLPLVSHTPVGASAAPVQDSPPAAESVPPLPTVRAGHVLIVGGAERDIRRIQAGLELGGHHVSWVEDFGAARRVLSVHPRRVDAIVVLEEPVAAAAKAAELRRALGAKIAHVAVLATTDDIEHSLSESLGMELDALLLRDPTQLDPAPVVTDAVVRRRTRSAGRSSTLLSGMFV